MVLITLTIVVHTAVRARTIHSSTQYRLTFVPIRESMSFALRLLPREHRRALAAGIANGESGKVERENVALDEQDDEEY